MHKICWTRQNKPRVTIINYNYNYYLLVGVLNFMGVKKKPAVVLSRSKQSWTVKYKRITLKYLKAIINNYLQKTIQSELSQSNTQKNLNFIVIFIYLKNGRSCFYHDCTLSDQIISKNFNWFGQFFRDVMAKKQNSTIIIFTNSQRTYLWTYINNNFEHWFSNFFII